jgi:hypothetical protein
MNAQNVEKKGRDFFSDVGLVIVDEAHMIMAGPPQSRPALARPSPSYQTINNVYYVTYLRQSDHRLP